MEKITSPVLVMPWSLGFGQNSHPHGEKDASLESKKVITLAIEIPTKEIISVSHPVNCLIAFSCPSIILCVVVFLLNAKRSIFMQWGPHRTFVYLIWR